MWFGKCSSAPETVTLLNLMGVVAFTLVEVTRTGVGVVCLNIMEVDMKYGSYDKLPHYAVVGHATNFYLWINEDGNGSSSHWIRGVEAFAEYNNLRNNYKNKRKWIGIVKRLWIANKSDS